MEKREVIICPNCGRVKELEKFVRMDAHSVQTFRMSRDRFVIVENLCPECLGLSSES